MPRELTSATLRLMMPDRYDFDEISVFIPGYTVEDLPTDLADEPAESLLNAFAAAWHPVLIAQCGCIPKIRHPDMLRQFTGRHILLVPTATEDWMPHQWQQDSQTQIHSVLRECTVRTEWTAAIESLFPARSDDPTPDDPILSVRPFLQVPDDFMAFGTAYLMVILLSRRMHHFVDPDESFLNREMTAAAKASLAGDAEATKLGLQKCFEHLRETREKFYPLDCLLVDLCIPGPSQSADELAELFATTPHLNLTATAAEVIQWATDSEKFVHEFQQQTASGNLSLLTGHLTEVRSGLVAPVTLLEDMACARELLQSTLNYQPAQWARRRFGLLASLPEFLVHFGYQAACHVALDDGIYPDRERSQFDWESADGSALAATSRIPLAIDSAVSVLKLPDRFRESMQDDTVAVLYLARLPKLSSPWLSDLRTCADYAPVLGEFVTVDTLTSRMATYRSRQRFEHGEYLSPALIQSAVLKTESPVSGPAALFLLWRALSSASVLQAVTVMQKCRPKPDNDVKQMSRLVREMLEQEDEHADIGSAESSRISEQFAVADKLLTEVNQLITDLTASLLDRIPHLPSPLRGQLIFNSLPFGRTCLTRWPADWQLPAENQAVEGLCVGPDNHQLSVRLPPGGFVWLTEAGQQKAVSPLKPPRNEPPLAEQLMLRNRHFEVSMSPRHGGIESVTYFQTRTNRLSQHVAFRYEREQKVPVSDDNSGSATVSTWYATTRLVESRVLTSTALTGEVETIVEIRSPTDDRVLGVCRQTTSVHRFLPRIFIRLNFEPMEDPVSGNPWMTYFGCRFAWESELAAVSRSVAGQTAGFRGDRIESPDFFEVAGDHQRLTVTTHGRPWHRRTGPRMIDSLLICEGEVSREFLFTIDFDQPVPHRCALDAMTPPIVVQTNDRVPKAASGWLLGLTARNVMLARTRVIDSPETRENADDNPAKSIRIRCTLIETEGIAVSCGFRMARRPHTACLIDGDGRVTEPLEIQEDGVTIHLGAFQLRELEFSF